MGRKNQIEDMEKIIEKMPWRIVQDSFGCRISNCAELAEYFYNQGCRKQRHGENLTNNHPVDEFICSECGLITRDNASWEIDEDADGDETQYEFEIRFCPRCGVKIKEME